MMPKTVQVHYHVTKDAEALSLATASWITSAVEQSISARGIARIAISGGNTPKGTFALLADRRRSFASVSTGLG